MFTDKDMFTNIAKLIAIVASLAIMIVILLSMVKVSFLIVMGDTASTTFLEKVTCRYEKQLGLIASNRNCNSDVPAFEQLHEQHENAVEQLT